MSRTIVLGERYELRDSAGSKHDYQFIHYNSRSGKYTVRDMQRKSTETKRVKLDTHTIVRRVSSKTNKSTTELYILKTGANIYKIGCTDDLDARMRAGRTWCSNMSRIASRTIPKPKTGNWRRYENKLHSRFSQSRCQGGGNEVFKFTVKELQDAAGYMNRMRFD